MMPQKIPKIHQINYHQIFMKYSYYQNNKLLPIAHLGSYETVEDTTSSRFENKQSASINDNIIFSFIKHNLTKRRLQTTQCYYTASKLKTILSQNKIKSTKTVCLNEIFGKELNVHKLYNIFSNLGILQYKYLTCFSIRHILYIKLSEFRNSLIIIFAANYSIEKLVGLNTLYVEQDYITLKFDAENNQILFPRSQIPHILILKKVSSNSEMMWDIFSKLLFLLNSQFKFMCLIKIETRKQTFEVVALMHNENVDGRNIQISFTKAKI
ncbi:unnamed protein product (macronuclear) [Paramecium tetraurelia]|uniref:RRM domain-containing protein n=1 Tax=Paramecium tetraurelia TaxID=5888 RepID=A0DFU3_PARTE|nr:uncharacterized protein GSPATT00016723001 [Paramecium tetraurelia]CAK81910.1 unnamed protein product [Paramecium tetraurelia]|eukprot:XP_001449307.1 hypothetical protein (macronuclear) [Paramecium tetraurelia strain d4-2]